jgi:hypothetical protein
MTGKVKEAIWMIMRPKLELLKAIRKRGWNEDCFAKPPFFFYLKCFLPLLIDNCILCMVASFIWATPILIVLYICMKILLVHLFHQRESYTDNNNKNTKWHRWK